MADAGCVDVDVAVTEEVRDLLDGVVQLLEDVVAEPVDVAVGDRAELGEGQAVAVGGVVRQDGRVADGDHLGVGCGLVHVGQHLDVLVLDPGELVRDALHALGGIGVVVAAGLSGGALFEAGEEHAAEGQAVAADADGDDVGLIADVGPLDLRVHGGPAVGRGLDRADRRLPGLGDVVDGGVAAADVRQVDGLARRELGELLLDEAGVGAGGAVAAVPRSIAQGGQRVTDEDAGGVRVAQRGPLVRTGRTGGAGGCERGGGQCEPDGQGSRAQTGNGVSHGSSRIGKGRPGPKRTHGRRHLDQDHPCCRTGFLTKRAYRPRSA